MVDLYTKDELTELWDKMFPEDEGKGRYFPKRLEFKVNRSYDSVTAPDCHAGREVLKHFRTDEKGQVPFKLLEQFVGVACEEKAHYQAVRTVDPLQPSFARGYVHSIALYRWDRKR